MNKKQEILKRFHQKYDFSENKTLEYDNLVGIADFISENRGGWLYWRWPTPSTS